MNNKFTEISMDDVQAVRRLKSGDLTGLETLVNRYQKKAVRTAFLITQDEQLAEDVAQEVFVQIYRHIQNFDENRPFAPYLLRSISNGALNAIEKTNRWVQFGAGANVERVAALLTTASSVEDQVDYARLKDEITHALAALPARQRMVVIQRYYLGMNEQEMADSLSAPPGTIKWLLNNARQRLRNLLQPERNIE